MTFAQGMKEELLQIHATLIPKLLMMDYDIDKKIHNDTIKITVVYESSAQKEQAQHLQKYIHAKYPQGINNKKIDLNFIPYSQLKNDKDSTLYYLLHTSHKEISKAVTLANHRAIITFCYDQEDLQYGVMLSIKVTNKVKPLINVEALKEASITLRPLLLKVAELYYHSTSFMEFMIYDQQTLYNV